MSEAEATTSMEEDLEAAFDASEIPEGTEESGRSDEDTEESVGSAEAEDTGEGEEVADEDEEGEEEGAEEAAEDEAGEEDDGADEQVASTKAPVSWSPDNREHWNKLPSEVQEQVTKREREIESGLRDASDARKFTENFFSAVKPFEQTIQVEAGGDALLATRNLMNIATGLRVGAMPQKAQLVAQIIQTYGVDVATLDDILSGQVGTAQPQVQQPVGDPANFRDPRVDQMIANQKQSDDQENLEIQGEIETFLADPANEFAMDVKDDMADLMEMAGRRNQELSLPDAYKKALAMSNSVQSVLKTRSSDKTSLKRKKRAAKTIGGSPAGDGTNLDTKGNSMNQDVSAAWDAVVGGEN